MDNCQRINYEDAYYIILAYVDQTFAWRTDQFTNWGDWDAHPGLSADHFWTGPPLFYQLEYIGDDSGGGDIPWLAIVAGIAVVAAAVVAVMVLKSKGKKKGGDKDEGSSPLGD